jgi:hypothetical protein
LIGTLDQSRLKAMRSKLITVLILLAAISAAIRAQPQDSNLITVAPARTLSELLPDSLAGTKATSLIEYYDLEQLTDTAQDQQVFQEYRVSSAASRHYGSIRADIFQTEHPFGAFGLFSYISRGPQNQPPAIGFGSAWSANGLTFWKSNVLVRLTSQAQQAKAARRGLAHLASAIAERINTSSTVNLPPLLASLPRQPFVPIRPRYLLGPRSLGAFIEHGGEMFDFAGDAEAVIAEYQAGEEAPPMKLVIIEYHTPQLAYDAINRARNYLASLPETEQSRIIIKREGNYIVEATDFDNREVAEQLVGSVKYPFIVKWLRNPLLPTRDPFSMKKTGQVLLSTFGIIGIMLMATLFVGVVFGTVIFIKRRKRLENIFTDAGEMLRLDLDPLPGVAPLNRRLPRFTHSNQGRQKDAQLGPYRRR